MISKEKSTMTQAASNSHNVPNFMMCRHEHENLLNAVSSMELMHGLSWSTAQIGGGVQETPPTQQNRNEIFKFWFIIKTAKISTQASITWVACSLVLDFNEGPEGRSSYGDGWSREPTPTCRGKQKEHLSIVKSWLQCSRAKEETTRCPCSVVSNKSCFGIAEPGTLSKTEQRYLK